MLDYRAPGWLPGGNLQTIWPALFSSRPGAPPPYRRVRWETPDGDFIDVDRLPGQPGQPDFIDVDRLPGQPGQPLLVAFHGLEGSSHSHYALALAHAAQARGWAYAVPHFRGCSGELNRAPRAYHSGDHQEIGWILERLRAQQGSALLAVGISLGGNALLRWAEESGDSAAATARAVVAVSSPVDLAAAGRAIDLGFNRLAYTGLFLRSMKPKALAKWLQFPGLFDRERMRAARTLFEFDDIFTGPLHGFKGTVDYWARASAKPHLQQVRIPALVLNARNDPFVPGISLPRRQDVGSFVTLWQPAHGGHAGFPGGRFPGHLMSMPEQVTRWLAEQT